MSFFGDVMFSKSKGLIVYLSLLFLLNVISIYLHMVVMQSGQQNLPGYLENIVHFWINIYCCVCCDIYSLFIALFMRSHNIGDLHSMNCLYCDLASYIANIKFTYSTIIIVMWWIVHPQKYPHSSISNNSTIIQMSGHLYLYYLGS